MANETQKLEVDLVVGLSKFGRGLAKGVAMLGSFGKAAGRAVVAPLAYGAKLTRFLAGIAMKLAKIGLVAGAAATGLAWFFTKAASDAEETEAKFSAVFKQLTAKTAAWSDAFADKFYRARVDVQRWLAGLQDTFVPLGFARKKAAALSKQLVMLSVDLASFNNLTTQQVMEDLTSALVGNHETVRKYGVIITEATLKAYAYAKGIAAAGAALTEEQKILSRVGLIMKNTSDAQGDAARTAGSFANRLRGLIATLKNIRATIGKVLLPTMTRLVAFAGKWAKRSERWLRRNRKALQREFAALVRWLIKEGQVAYAWLAAKAPAVWDWVRQTYAVVADHVKRAGGLVMTLDKWVRTAEAWGRALSAFFGPIIRDWLTGFDDLMRRINRLEKMLAGNIAAWRDWTTETLIALGVNADKAEHWAAAIVKTFAQVGDLLIGDLNAWADWATQVALALGATRFDAVEFGNVVAGMNKQLNDMLHGNADAWRAWATEVAVLLGFTRAEVDILFGDWERGFVVLTELLAGNVQAWNSLIDEWIGKWEWASAKLATLAAEMLTTLRAFVPFLGSEVATQAPVRHGKPQPLPDRPGAMVGASVNLLTETGAAGAAAAAGASGTPTINVNVNAPAVDRSLIDDHLVPALERAVQQGRLSLEAR